MKSLSGFGEKEDRGVVLGLHNITQRHANPNGGSYDTGNRTALHTHRGAFVGRHGLGWSGHEDAGWVLNTLGRPATRPAVLDHAPPGSLCFVLCGVIFLVATPVPDGQVVAAPHAETSGGNEESRGLTDVALLECAVASAERAKAAAALIVPHVHDAQRKRHRDSAFIDAVREALRRRTGNADHALPRDVVADRVARVVDDLAWVASELRKGIEERKADARLAEQLETLLTAGTGATEVDRT